MHKRDTSFKWVMYTSPHLLSSSLSYIATPSTTKIRKHLWSINETIWTDNLAHQSPVTVQRTNEESINQLINQSIIPSVGLISLRKKQSINQFIISSVGLISLRKSDGTDYLGESVLQSINLTAPGENERLDYSVLQSINLTALGKNERIMNQSIVQSVILTALHRAERINQSVNSAPSHTSPRARLHVVGMLWFMPLI